MLVQSQDDIDPYVTTQGHRKQRSRYRLPVIPIWFGIISGALLLTAWFAVMIGVLRIVPDLPHLCSCVTRPCQRLFRKAPPWVSWVIISHGIAYLEWLSDSFPATWDQSISALEGIFWIVCEVQESRLWIVCALHDFFRIHVQRTYPLPWYIDISPSPQQEIFQIPHSIDFMSCRSVGSFPVCSRSLLVSEHKKQSKRHAAAGKALVRPALEI